MGTLTIAALAALASAVVSGQTLGPLRAVPFVTGLQSPTAFVADPTDRAVFYALEQAGRVRVVRNRALAEDLLDFRGAIASGGERGFLGLALAPDFATSGRFYVNFTNLNGDTVVARFRKAAGGGVVPGSRFDLRFNGANQAAVIGQPFSNHNGGHLAFGPDGMLYIGLGDGGSGNDPSHLAQNPASLLGKMLRLDASVPDDHPIGYVVPDDNPFGRPGGPLPGARREIWSLGLRNPWRYSFDDVALGGTGALVMGDVGQNRFEEIDYEPRARSGRNYGWRNREGAHDNVSDLPAATQPLIDPIHEYGRNEGVSVTGGYVYRGSALGSEHRGRYVYADFSGRVRSLGLAIDGNGDARVTGVVDHTGELGGSAVLGTISSFATDPDGELYILSHSRGVVLKVVGTPPSPQNLRIIR